VICMYFFQGWLVAGSPRKRLLLLSAAVCCSVLQCVAVCCSVLQCVAVCCREVQRLASSTQPTNDTTAEV